MSPGDTPAPEEGTSPPESHSAVAARTRRQLARYTLGSFGTGLISTVPSVLLLYFCTEIIRIAPGIAGAIVFVPKLLSVIWDPLVGRLADRLQRPRTLLLAGVAGASIGFVATFSPPPLDSTATSAWVALSYLILAASIGLYATPYIAFVAQVDVDPPLRTWLVARRSMIASTGVLTGASVAPWIVSLAGGGRAGYSIMGLLLGTCCAVAMSVPLRLVGSGELRRRAPRPMLTRSFAGLLRNRAFLKLSAVFLVTQVATGALLAALPYAVTTLLGRDDADIGWLMMVAIGTSIVSSMPWSRLPARVGDRRAVTLCLGSSTAVALVFGLALVPTTPWFGALLLAGALGLQMAGPQVLLYARAAQVAHESAPASEATFTGLWLALDKVGISGGAALLAMVLAAADTERASAIHAFLWVGPTALFALATALSWRFGLVNPARRTARSAT